MFQSFTDLLNRMLGRCPKCMRQAFLAALSAGAFAAAASLLEAGAWIATPLIAAAIGLTCLWLAHVAVFALRVTMSEKEAGAGLPDAGVPLSRRKFAADFAKTAAFAILGTAFALGASSAFAQGRCDCSRCRSDQVCCRTANGQCGCFPGSIRC